MARPKRHVAEYLAICAQGDFVFRASIQIIKDHLRQPAFRQSPKIVNVDGFRELYARRMSRP